MAWGRLLVSKLVQVSKGKVTPGNELETQTKKIIIIIIRHKTAGDSCYRAYKPLGKLLPITLQRTWGGVSLVLSLLSAALDLPRLLNPLRL